MTFIGLMRKGSNERIVDHNSSREYDTHAFALCITAEKC